MASLLWCITNTSSGRLKHCKFWFLPAASERWPTSDFFILKNFSFKPLNTNFFAGKVVLSRREVQALLLVSTVRQKPIRTSCGL